MSFLLLLHIKACLAYIKYINKNIFNNFLIAESHHTRIRTRVSKRTRVSLVITQVHMYNTASVGLNKTMDLKAIVRETDLIFFSLLLLIPLFYLYFKHIFSKNPPLPPGPFAWPNVGNFFQTGRQLHSTLANLAKVHGPLMSLRLGTQISIIASSPEAAREVLKTHDNFSLAAAPECNDYWRSLRAICKADLFSAKALKSQNHIGEMKVIRELVDFLGSKEGEVVYLGEAIYVTYPNILTNAIFSVDFVDLESKGIGNELRKLIVEVVELGMIPDLSSFYPIIKVLDIQDIQKKCDKIVQKFISIWEDIIKERRKQECTILVQRDFLDAMINDGFTNDQISQLILVLSLSTHTKKTKLALYMI